LPGRRVVNTASLSSPTNDSYMSHCW
jgi:hypothetical protein